MSQDPDEPELIPIFRDDPRYTGQPRANLVTDKKTDWLNPNVCKHDRGMIVDRAARTVECKGCGALLDPFEALFLVSEAAMRLAWMYEEVREHRKREHEKRLKEHERRQNRKRS